MKRFIVVVLVLSGIFTMASSCAAESDGLDELALAYRSGSERERIQIFLDAADKGLICRGCDLAVMDRIFSTNFRALDESAKGFDSLYKGVVYFRDGEEPKKNAGGVVMAEGGRGGWYLGFRYTEDGKIHDYFLTNLGK